MSYIEKKYNKKILEIFENLPNLERELLELLEQKSNKNINDIARLCAKFNKEINLILRKYYPEIKQLNDKLVIKSSLMFYYDLIDKLTDLIRNIENFQNIDDRYYDTLIQFVNDKDELILGKYKNISIQELTAFYDKSSRQNLEKILLEKLERRNREFFNFGSLEQEIRKRARIAGADYISISSADALSKEDLPSANSVINYSISDVGNEKLLQRIGEELKEFLESKQYKAVIKYDSVITDVKLLNDKI